MTDPLAYLDNDDIDSIRRYRPFGTSGIDRTLRRLQAILNHPAMQTNQIIAAEIPRDTAAYMATLPDNLHNDNGHCGVVLNAFIKACKAQA